VCDVRCVVCVWLCLFSVSRCVCSVYSLKCGFCVLWAIMCFVVSAVCPVTFILLLSGFCARVLCVVLSWVDTCVGCLCVTVHVVCRV